MKHGAKGGPDGCNEEQSICERKKPSVQKMGITTMIWERLEEGRGTSGADSVEWIRKHRWRTD
jgi:hypothetical protein